MEAKIDKTDQPEDEAEDEEEDEDSEDKKDDKNMNKCTQGKSTESPVERDTEITSSTVLDSDIMRASELQTNQVEQCEDSSSRKDSEKDTNKTVTMQEGIDRINDGTEVSVPTPENQSHKKSEQGNHVTKSTKRSRPRKLKVR